MIYHLDNRLYFPDPANAEPDGLLAVGGDLSVERLKLAYQMGIFPWFNEDDPILWFSPHQRCVLFPQKIVQATSMRQFLRNTSLTITRNKAFKQVVQQCSVIKRHGQDGTWITEDMISAYHALFLAGNAESIEVWKGDELVGGLYGVISGRVFCGESMFSLVNNASKMALIHQCKKGGYDLIDCQMPNDHLLRMGAEMIDRTTYSGFLTH